MKGTILDFLKLASENPDLAEELIELATRHGFEFSDEVSDRELETVAGGAIAPQMAESLIDGAVSPTTAVTDQWKAALVLLADVAERNTQNTQSLTNI